MKQFLGAFVCLLLVSCGRGVGSLENPFGPSVPIEQVQVLSGRTSQPIGGALVTRVPDGVEVQASGFLRLVTARTAKVVLWPNDAELPVSFTRALVHHNGMTIRWGLYVHRISIQLPAEMNRPDIRMRMDTVAQTLNSAQNSIQFAINDYSSDAQITIAFDARDSMFVADPNIVGVAHVDFFRNGTIQKATIVFPSAGYAEFRGWFEVVLLHELGHTLGLWHTPTGSSGLMLARLESGVTTFTSQERLTIHMIYERIPGTVLRDETEFEAVSVSTSDEVQRVSIQCTASVPRQPS